MIALSGEISARSLEQLVGEAKAGNRTAVEELIRRIQDRIYGLALRMLWHPADAEDASQEILIRILTSLGSFRGESSFSTWVYRVASNYLLTTRKRRMEHDRLTFQAFGEDLERGLGKAAEIPASSEQALLIQEVKIGCTHGMLLCLNREHRLAFILGEVFELTDREAAEILEISAAAFRKRLSRARSRLYAFMAQHCGLVNPKSQCRCAKRADVAIQVGRVNPKDLLFASHPAIAHPEPSLMEKVSEMEELHDAAAIFRSHPEFAAPESLLPAIKDLIGSGKFTIMST
jgi:RNA polymerase sigma factor (sigma-70 family)